ncbi:MAG TPA: ABC transporter substrate-binding protein [Candidatus Dormibacteraeota bacterium]|nr:ABC transporter substrate-binding protein [Candidatus Dormibacteraeota bacterium]
MSEQRNLWGPRAKRGRRRAALGGEDPVGLPGPRLVPRVTRAAGIAFGVLVALAIGACQPIATLPKPAKGGTAIEALVGSPGPLNPLFEQDDATRDVDSVIYQGLTTVDANQQVVGLLASNWAISPDHLTYTFTLRNGIKWADGEPFTVDDVLFTFSVLQDPEYDLPGSAFWRQLGVAQAGVNQVVFTLRAPSAAFPIALRIGIIAKHLFNGMAPPQISASAFSAARALGTGPFKVASIDSRGVTLDRNPYAVPQPYLDHLDMRTYPANNPQAAILAVRSGAADLVGGLEPEELNALENAGDVTVMDVRTYTNAFVSMNAEGEGKPYFGDVNVRRAIVQAINRDSVISEVLGGRAETDPTPIPAGDWAYADAGARKYPYDALAAAHALDSAGWTIPSGQQFRTNRSGLLFQVNLVVSDSFPNRQIADAVARQLAGVGIDVKVKAVPSPDLIQNYLVGHSYQMAMVVFDVGPDPDLYSLWHSGATAGSLNFAYSHGWGLIDKDLEDGRAAVDQPERLAAYTDFQLLIADQAPAIFLYSAHYDYAVSGRVRGVHLNRVIEPSDRFQYVTDWYVNTSA